MPDGERVAEALLMSRITTGWGFPISLLQRSVPDLERMAPDLGSFRTRRDQLCGALSAQGYDLLVPEGTFYVLVRSPIDDDRAFCDRHDSVARRMRRAQPPKHHGRIDDDLVSHRRGAGE
jgi:aspartate aminotransferase